MAGLLPGAHCLRAYKEFEERVGYRTRAAVPGDRARRNFLFDPHSTFDFEIEEVRSGISRDMKSASTLRAL